MPAAEKLLDAELRKTPYLWEKEEGHFSASKHYEWDVLGHVCKAVFPVRFMSQEQENVNIEIDRDYVVTVPNLFADLARSIERSRQILYLEDGWDDDGSKGYDRQTLVNAIEFIKKSTIRIWESSDVVIDAPAITPGADGSIDLLWRNEHYDLLIVVPAYPESTASFYGDDYGSTKIEGTFDISNVNINSGILMFLRERQLIGLED